MEFGKPTFEKLDKNTLRIKIQKIDDVPLAQIVFNKEQLGKQKEALTLQYSNKMKQIEVTLGRLNEILEEAKKLGIVAKKPKPAKKAKK